MFDFLVQDSLCYLSQQPDKSISNIIMTIPEKDANTTTENYLKWVCELVSVIFKKIDPDGFVILTDNNTNDKSYLVNNTIYDNGFKILWTKLIPNGDNDDPNYSNMVCYSKEGSQPSYTDSINVSRKVNAEELPCLFIKKHSKTLGKNKYDVINLCINKGMSVLYCLSNGLDVLGIDNNYEKIRKLKKILKKAGY